MIEVGTQERRCHSRRNTFGRKIDGRKMNCTITQILVCIFLPLIFLPELTSANRRQNIFAGEQEINCEQYG